MLLVFPASICCAVDTETRPFVPGFERFGIHEDIDESAAGRLLMTELSCVACHPADASELSPKRGPSLDGVGSRVQRAYLHRFLSDPHAVKPGTTMPNVLASLPQEQRQSAIESLVAYLASLTANFPNIKGSGANPVPYQFWLHGDEESGRHLYHKIGCVACHAAEDAYPTIETQASPLDAILEQLDPEQLEELGLSSAARRVPSVPLGDLREKYTKESLTHFLLAPEKVRPAGRMPNLKLLVVEAADLAAYLLSESETKNGDRGREESPVASSKDLITQGREHFVAFGCANCHDVQGTTATKHSVPISQWSTEPLKGCLDADDRDSPRFKLSQPQVQAILAAIADGDDHSPNHAESVEAILLRMNCYACHQRDEIGGVGRYRKAYFETVNHVDLGDEGRLPPPLTHIGAKLHSTWLSQVLQGKATDLRPHMHIRMPIFPGSVAKSLVPTLTKADEASTLSAEQVFGDTKGLADDGRDLMDIGCVQCHQFNGNTLPGIVGIDLNNVSKRIRPQWFHDFLLNPVSLKARTRMPTFFPKGKSSNTEILHGDADRQIAAMWVYLTNIQKHGLPTKIDEARSQDFELVPKDRPIVLRTFMPFAGEHAIAVGFPQKVHFAFDALHCRPAIFWRDRFLDAQGTWFIRFAPPAEPLSKPVIELPRSQAFAELKDLDEPWPEDSQIEHAYTFGGYRLDVDGVPTMLYRWNGMSFEDKLEATDDKTFRRTITWAFKGDHAKTSNIWLLAASGKTLTPTDDGGYLDPQAFKVYVSPELRTSAKLRTWSGHQEYLIPVDLSRKEVELEYRW
ncbi:MAG: c-type cytochrome [Pirellulaceae bacterium]